MDASKSKNIKRREVEGNIWLTANDSQISDNFIRTPILSHNYEVLESEKAVGQAMFEELKTAVAAKNGGDLVMLLLGGRGAQAMYRIVGEKPKRMKLTKYWHICTFSRKTRLRRWR